MATKINITIIVVTVLPLVGTGARTGDDADRFVSSSFRHRQVADLIQILNFFW